MKTSILVNVHKKGWTYQDENDALNENYHRLYGFWYIFGGELGISIYQKTKFKGNEEFKGKLLRVTNGE